MAKGVGLDLARWLEKKGYVPPVPDFSPDFAPGAWPDYLPRSRIGKVFMFFRVLSYKESKPAGASVLRP